MHVASDWQARKKFVKKRSLQIVKEHFEQIFDAVCLSAAGHKHVLIIWRCYGTARSIR